MRILITGGNGQLARALRSVLSAEGHAVVAVSREVLDITQISQIEQALERWQPEAVINTAAFHQVDRCETDPEQSFLTNAAAPQRLASACGRRGALLVHISTDYVFAGERKTPYQEDDALAPISTYGASKAAGEMAVRATTENHLLIRTTGLYGLSESAKRGNFVETMLRLADEKTLIEVVHDQILTPSYAEDVSAAIALLMGSGARGTFHVTNCGCCSWYEFAREIFRLSELHPDLRPVNQAERSALARRPAYSVLGHAGLRSAGIPEPRPWQGALAAYLDGRNRNPDQVGGHLVT